MRTSKDANERVSDELLTPEDGHLSLLPVSTRRLGVTLVVAGVLGFLAAFTLSVERVALLLDPDYVPTCSINPILSCGSVMVTDQASLFGFPNPFIGIASFAVVLVLGFLMVSAVRPPRWMMAGLQVGVTLGLVLVGWLVSQSLYSINALCPYCMVVWAVVIPLFVTVTADNLDRGVIPVPKPLRGLARVLVEYRLLVSAGLLTTVVILVLVRFWYYWSTLLGL